MADSEILIEVYGTAPAIDTSLEIQQADPNVLIAALPIKGDTGNVGPQGIQGVQGVQGVQGPVGPQGERGISWTYSDVISQVIDSTLQNGNRVTFPLAHEAYASTVEVYRNGLMEFDGLGYGMTSPTTVTHVTFTTAPLNSDVIAVKYIRVQ